MGYTVIKGLFSPQDVVFSGQEQPLQRRVRRGNVHARMRKEKYLSYTERTEKNEKKNGRIT